MFLLLAATMCAGLFCGAALYVNLVEHPARMSCGQELAVREFAPSYHRATIMQVPLATGGFVLGLAAAWQLRDAWVAAGALLLGASALFTLIAILPTNKQLLDPALDARSARATNLLRRWNRLHGVRTILSAAAFGLLLARLDPQTPPRYKSSEKGECLQTAPIMVARSNLKTELLLHQPRSEDKSSVCLCVLNSAVDAGFQLPLP